jgi:hypothetical protein
MCRYAFALADSGSGEGSASCPLKPIGVSAQCFVSQLPLRVGVVASSIIAGAADSFIGIDLRCLERIEVLGPDVLAGHCIRTDNTDMKSSPIAST